MIITERTKQTLTYPACLMGVVALIVCSLLLFTHNLTQQPIADRQREELTHLLKQVLPDDVYNNQPLEQRYQHTIDGTLYNFYRARFNNQVSAIVIFTSTSGYSGEITMLMAIKKDGSLGGVRILSHTETPGLGDKIEATKSNWILQFTGLSLTQPAKSGWAVKKDGGTFDAFTGATITPRAVVKEIHKILHLFQAHRDFFLKETDLTPRPRS